MQRKKKVISSSRNKEMKEEKRQHADSFLSQTSDVIGSSTGGWTTRDAVPKTSKQSLIQTKV